MSQFIDDGKVGLREFTSLYLLTIATKFSDMTPALLLPLGLTATWMIPIISGCVMAVPFYVLLFVLHKTKSRNLIELIEVSLGRGIGFLITLTLFAISLAATILNSRSYIDAVSTLYMPHTPIAILYIVFIGFCFYIARSGFANMARTAWIVVPYVKIALVFLIVLVWEDINWLYIFPLGGPGLKELAINGLLHSSIYGEVILFAALAHLGVKEHTFKQASWIGLIIVTLELGMMYAIYILSFDYASASHIAYPFHQLARLANIGRFLTNLESFFLVFWFISSIIRVSIYLYVTVYLFSRLIKLENFLPLLLPFTAIILWVGLIPENTIEVELIYRDNYLLQFSWVLFIALPFVLWLFSSLKGANRERKAK